MPPTKVSSSLWCPKGLHFLAASRSDVTVFAKAQSAPLARLALPGGPAQSVALLHWACDGPEKMALGDLWLCRGAPAASIQRLTGPKWSVPWLHMAFGLISGGGVPATGRAGCNCRLRRLRSVALSVWPRPGSLCVALWEAPAHETLAFHTALPSPEAQAQRSWRSKAFHPEPCASWWPPRPRRGLFSGLRCPSRASHASMSSLSWQRQRSRRGSAGQCGRGSSWTPL